MGDEILDFDKFANSAIFNKLSDIREFALVADIPPISIWGENIFARRVIDQIYEHLRDVLKEAEFYYEDELKAVRETNQVAVSYDDDRYDFSVVCSETTIAIYRRGSSLRNFHEWYRAFMPSAQGILTRITSILTEELHRKIDILRASYRFKFVLHDLKSENTKRIVRNTEIMNKLLKGYLDEKGALIDDPALPAELGRTDVSMSRWVGGPGRRRWIRFSVEAPANMGYTSLWFTFSYTGQSYSSPEDEREPFDPDLILSDYDLAYTDFLRNSAINGFMGWLLDEYNFKSSPSTIP